MPRRRTFAAALRGLHSLDADFAPPSVAALVSNTGSRGTGSPSLLFREDSFLDSTDARG